MDEEKAIRNLPPEEKAKLSLQPPSGTQTPTKHEAFTGRKFRDARIQRIAIMEALGISPKDQNKATGGMHKYTTYQDRRIAYKKGYVEKVQEGMRKTAISLVEERRILAERCFDIVNKKAKSIIDGAEEIDENGTQKGIKLKEAEFALKAIGETEHSGRKTDAPRVTVNVRKNASLNIQQNFQDIGSILDRVGMGFGEIVGQEG